MMFCPRCGDRPEEEWTHTRAIFIDGAWRQYRKCKGCGVSVALEVRAKVPVA